MKLQNGLYSDGIMITSSFGVDHLHECCKRLGIPRAWFQVGKMIRYDIPVKKRMFFFQDHPEVERVTTKELKKMLKG